MEVKGHNGTVTCDDTFVTITRKGALARMTVGKGDKRVPIASINAVQWKPAGAMVNGYIEFSMGGGNENRSKFGSATVDAGKNENAVLFTKKQMPEFETLRAFIENKIVARHAHAGQSAQVAPDLAGQIKQLAELRDQGILSSDEFDAKKADLLSRM